MKQYFQERRYLPISVFAKTVSVIVISIAFIFASTGYAGDKIWNAAGDGSSWSDDNNWSPVVVPTSSDDVLIDIEDAEVVQTETFKAKSITIGGNQSSKLTSNNFIFGTITPAGVAEIAILNRKDGTFTLKGAGIVTVQGQYKDSEETLVAKPSFMFWVK